MFDTHINIFLRNLRFRLISRWLFRTRLDSRTKPEILMSKARPYFSHHLYKFAGKNEVVIRRYERWMTSKCGLKMYTQNYTLCVPMDKHLGPWTSRTSSILTDYKQYKSISRTNGEAPWVKHVTIWTSMRYETAYIIVVQVPWQYS